MSHLLVIGGTKGLGKAFVQTVASEYSQISVFARSTPEDLATEYPRIRFLNTDVTDSSSLRKGLGDAIAAGGKIHQLVLFQQFRGSEQPWDGKLACILTATRNVLEFCADQFVPEGDKAVVLLTSIASRMVADEQDSGYHAAKAGLLGLARYYAFKFGPVGVRVNCVSPGTVLKAATKQHFLDNPDLLDWFSRCVPLRRMGTEDEVASAIRFLLSSAASFITGQELIVDGGACLQSQESLTRTLFSHVTPPTYS